MPASISCLSASLKKSLLSSCPIWVRQLLSINLNRIIYFIYFILLLFFLKADEPSEDPVLMEDYASTAMPEEGFKGEVTINFALTFE